MAQNTLANVGDGYSKTSPNLLESKPYGDFNIEKLECILHVEKRMFRRLKDVKKILMEMKKLKKKRNEKEKEEPAVKRKRRSKTTSPEEKKTELTGKVMKEISLFYSLVIQNDPDDKQAMKKAFGRYFIIKFQLIKKPQHQYCDKSWYIAYDLYHCNRKTANFYEELTCGTKKNFFCIPFFVDNNM
ncbi:hypothetical protein HHI36_002740 [Cryptolaemus montrouzieri]|uniref:Mutator-like transposase domain-containing protein n=1 Tax=Cryptolaemus montrouzieri TaxID=559131 RepID=A0ABD2PBC5_9CUCU